MTPEPAAAEAVRARLTTERGHGRPTPPDGPTVDTPQPEADLGGWQSSTGDGEGWGADPATIVFQRTRVLPHCQMHSVAYTLQGGPMEGTPMEEVIRTWQLADGSWQVSPVGGGSGPGPYRPAPWVNFTAGSGPGGFSAGGRVEGTGSDRAHTVRLVFADGFAMEDVVEHGIVLFFAPGGVVFPAAVAIADDSGLNLATYTEFDGFPFIT